MQDRYKPYSSFGPYGAIPRDQRFDIQQQPNITATLKALEKEDANLEAERGELALKPDLSGIYKIGGKTHAKGGTPLNLEEGSFIFSNDKNLHFTKHEKKVFEFKEGGSVGKTKNTPAKVLSREIDVKHYNQNANILNDKSNTGYDVISKNSAALMLQKYQEKIGQVAFVQEAKKGFPTGVPDFSQNTAPLYNPQTKEKIEQNPQYMRYGGKMQAGGFPKYGNQYSPDWLQNVKPIPRTPFHGLEEYIDPNPWLTDAQSNPLNQNPNIQPVAPTSNPAARKSLGIPAYISPDKTGKWAGDAHISRNPMTGQMSNNWNAMTDYSSPEEYAKAVGYTGDAQNIKGMQQWVKDKYPDLVAKYHGKSGYGMPNAGTEIDGDLGVRWQAIANDIRGNDTPTKYQNISTEANAPKGMPQANVQAPTQGVNTNIPIAKGNNPLAANPFSGSTSQPYNPEVPLSPLQKANLAYSGFHALTVPRYSPQRMNVQSPLLELERYNQQPALNAVDNSAYQAYQNNRVTNPYQAGANNASIFGKSLDAKQQVIGDYANRNVGIANQQNEQNNQIQAGDLRFNTGANNNYYNQIQKLNQNYDDETRFARDQTVSLYNDYQSKNQELEQFLGSQRNAGKVQIGTNKDGSPIYQNMPLYAYDNTGFRPRSYYTGAGSLDSLPQQSSKANDLATLFQALKANGIDPGSTAGAKWAAVLGNNKAGLQTPYNYKKGGKVIKNPFK
jgi:hypothetical protein